MTDAFAIAKHLTDDTRIVKIAPLFGSTDKLTIGDLIRIEIFDYFFPLSISAGTVRITSVA
ncbi:MAG: hypothetical protein ACYTDW_13895, partial [Planctomycetota bacterium]